MAIRKSWRFLLEAMLWPKPWMLRQELPGFGWEIWGVGSWKMRSPAFTGHLQVPGVSDIFGIHMNTKHTERKQVCVMAFSPADYQTEADGQIWILGMPLFYEFLGWLGFWCFSLGDIMVELCCTWFVAKHLHYLQKNKVQMDFDFTVNDGAWLRNGDNNNDFNILYCFILQIIIHVWYVSYLFANVFFPYPARYTAHYDRGNKPEEVTMGFTSRDEEPCRLHLAACMFTFTFVPFEGHMSSYFCWWGACVLKM